VEEEQRIERKRKHEEEKESAPKKRLTKAEMLGAKPEKNTQSIANFFKKK
jgi:hypothetical protein